MLTLWDYVANLVQGTRARRPRAKRPQPSPRDRPSTTKAQRYESLVRDMLAEHRVTVRRWRTGTTGVAWVVERRDGVAVRYIESPRPKTPISAAVFLHEIGHHVLGIGVCSPRCLEEYHAWVFALTIMEQRRLEVTELVRRRMRRSLEYAVAKAIRRGIRTIPAELVPYIPPRYRMLYLPRPDEASPVRSRTLAASAKALFSNARSW